MTIEYPDRFKNFFNDLETRRTLLTSITETHNKLINTFTSLDENLTQKSQTLDTEIENLKKNTEETLEAIKIREDSLLEKEVTLSADVERLKDNAIKGMVEGTDSEAKTTPDLFKMWFRRMDFNGLLNCLLDRRKDSIAVREEIMVAMTESVDVLGFVLDAIEDFVQIKVSGKKLNRMADRRWVYGMLIQAALPIGGDGGGVVVAKSLKERAMAVLEIWKGVLGGGEGSDGVGSVEAAMFLEIVIGFGLKDKWDDEFLMKLIMEYSGRKEMPKLALALGYGDKMKDIIDELMKTGKEADAVYFACETGLTEQYPPVPLLKACLRKYREITCKLTSSLEDVNNEVNCVKAAIKCVEDHKLESHFTIANLKQRLKELDRIRSRRMYIASFATSNPSNKRARHGRGSRPPKFVRMALAARQKKESQSPTVTSYGSQSPTVGHGLQYAYPSNVASSSAPTY
ncbi:FRIGIDA-like protein 4b [Rutidosis leptorrhynchoides]|uniref:FRIGIDA-like protein 4b n=1 Tax=Rutidosis leptorrhynchoides TaxID=125765 RepID=UPI003A99BC54